MKKRYCEEAISNNSSEVISGVIRNLIAEMSLVVSVDREILINVEAQ